MGSPVFGEFLRIDVSFDDIGCASCIESLEERLRRARGVERVEIDPAKRAAAIHLEPGNRVRLTPLLSRITQDGTKILRTRAEARGTISGGAQSYTFQPSGLAQTLRLQLPSGGPDTFEDGMMYQVTGEIIEPGPGGEAMLAAEKIERISGAK